MAGPTAFPASAIVSGTLDPARLPTPEVTAGDLAMLQGRVGDLALSAIGKAQIEQLKGIAGYPAACAWFSIALPITASHLGSGAYAGNSGGPARVIRWDGTLGPLPSTSLLNVGEPPGGSYRISSLPLGIMPVASGGSAPSGVLTSISIRGAGVTAFDGVALSSLTLLDLEYNRLSSFDTTVLSALATLRIGFNPISEINFASTMPSLQSLDVAGTEIATLRLDRLPNLQNVFFHASKVERIVWPESGALPGISVFAVIFSEFDNFLVPPIVDTVEKTNAFLASLPNVVGGTVYISTFGNSVDTTLAQAKGWTVSEYYIG